MPILGAVVLVIQLCFAYHALKTGRPWWWIGIIMGFPVAGCLLYYFIEVFPNTRESRKAEKAVQAIVKSFDPDKTLREKVANLEDCGSVENRIVLARSCMERRLYRDAASLYRSCLAGVYAQDPEIRFGLASALLGAEDFQEAHVVAAALRKSHAQFRAAEVQLIGARALGEEGRWRYGALLLRMGRVAEAGELFRRMVRNAERMPQHYREAQHEWLALAREQVKS